MLQNVYYNLTGFSKEIISNQTRYTLPKIYSLKFTNNYLFFTLWSLWL